MIISCPECAGPFEVPDDQIAALVQVECPHCSFRMILDFAAANDPGLVEQGMRMASGYRSAADYRSATRGPALPSVAEVVAAPEPVLTEVPAVAEASEPTEPAAETPAPSSTPSITPSITVVAAEPEPEPVAPAARTVVSTPAATPPVSEPARVVAPEPAADLDDDDDVAVRMPTSARPAMEVGREDEAEDGPTSEELTAAVVVPPVRADIPPVRTDIPPVRTDIPPVRTDIPPVRTPPTAEPVVTPASQPPRAVSAEHPTFDNDDDAPTLAVPPEAREAARREMEAERARVAARKAAEADAAESTPSGRLPPHTPPGRAKSAPSEVDDSGSKTKPRPAPRLEALDDIEQDQPPKEGMSTLGIVTVVVLLLMALSLVGASMALENTPDPRPLLEKLYRQYVLGG